MITFKTGYFEYDVTIIKEVILGAILARMFFWASVRGPPKFYLRPAFELCLVFQVRPEGLIKGG